MGGSAEGKLSLHARSFASWSATWAAWLVINAPVFSSHGFVVGHVVPEAQVGGPIALIRDGDIIYIDAEANTMDMAVLEEELERRRKAWSPPPLKVSQGTLYKYTKVVADASHGCITDS
jgi:dihydroxy-acid dehydratase